jgi:hypothetical protein
MMHILPFSHPYEAGPEILRVIFEKSEVAPGGKISHK